MGLKRRNCVRWRRVNAVGSWLTTRLNDISVRVHEQKHFAPTTKQANKVVVPRYHDEVVTSVRQLGELPDRHLYQRWKVTLCPY